MSFTCVTSLNDCNIHFNGLSETHFDSFRMKRSVARNRSLLEPLTDIIAMLCDHFISMTILMVIGALECFVEV